MLTRPTPARRKYRDPDDWHRSDGGVWLPGAADVPLRGAGMVRRGMGFGFEPAGCCCESPFCEVDISLGRYYDVTFSGIPSSATCDEYPPGYTKYCYDTVYEDIDLNHTYRLANTNEFPFTSQTCEWELVVENAYTLVDCYDPLRNTPCNGYFVQEYPHYVAYPLPYSFGVKIRMTVGELYGDPSKIQARMVIIMYPETMNQATSDLYPLDKGVDALDGWTGSGDTSVCCQTEMFANWSWSVARV